MTASPLTDQLRLGRTHRTHRPGRTQRITIAYDQDEFCAVRVAAAAAGLTPTGYVAEAALAAAIDQLPPRVEPLREVLLELMAARTQVRRFGVNVNQAVRELNTTGTAPEWLSNAVALTSRAVRRIDGAATQVAQLLS